MKIKGNKILCEYGFMIERKGSLFIFSDLNPQVEFQRKLSTKDRLKICWFLLRSIFNTPKEGDK